MPRDVQGECVLCPSSQAVEPRAYLDAIAMTELNPVSDPLLVILTFERNRLNLSVGHLVTLGIARHMRLARMAA